MHASHRQGSRNALSAHRRARGTYEDAASARAVPTPTDYRVPPTASKRLTPSLPSRAGWEWDRSRCSRGARARVVLCHLAVSGTREAAPGPRVL
ncbi:hypothetical protein PR202_gb02689 [Eleusine coracana subsp. coracana]|uniref:Uncharacterized protein n=1 Tax=Eleusine coracana subsp. coracana TaxID=191504 RepID=A0AAV5DZP4_ELECO|nr:hypothetical protein PR202_gb02689 [Eleusine coracana subsp. coracana]